MQASNLATGTYTDVSIQAISKNVLLRMQQAGHTELLHEIMGYDPADNFTPSALHVHAREGLPA